MLYRVCIAHAIARHICGAVCAFLLASTTSLPLAIETLDQILLTSESRPLGLLGALFLRHEPLTCLHVRGSLFFSRLPLSVISAGIGGRTAMGLGWDMCLGYFDCMTR